MVDTAVFYFSASGVTAQVGELLARTIGADVFEIMPKEKYTREDLDWHDAQSRSSVEMKDPTCRPEFMCRAESLEKYKAILLGFPIWWYEAPRIIQSFLEKYDFAGKKILVFATSGGSGLGKTVEILAQSAPNAQWLEGKRLAANVSVKELADWAESSGI